MCKNVYIFLIIFESYIGWGDYNVITSYNCKITLHLNVSLFPVIKYIIFWMAKIIFYMYIIRYKNWEHLKKFDHAS